MANAGSPPISRAGAGGARRCGGRLTRVDLLTVALAGMLCWASYTLSVWHNNRGAADSSVLRGGAAGGGYTACGDADEELDFASHHAADDAGLSVSSGAAANPTPRRALRATATAAANSGLNAGDMAKGIFAHVKAAPRNPRGQDC
uniref:Uncharacterized protein n=1 Tax=Leersia perrieri TaxID=77586 RepID=A0A0D9XLP1_9ORYZ